MIGLAVFWLRNQFALKTELSQLGARLDAKCALIDGKLIDHAQRLTLVELECKSPPTRHELQTELASMRERMGSLEGGIGSIQRQLGTTNDYLQALLEQGLRK
ncbi:hypothetical protein [Sphingomonas sp. SORGH_AS_0879]|uniref:hypothetical protein n=1 Tax=Sphingomonas sp. SORGH_AS_0879 TaxID=3041790 RepID=UPI0027D78B72|nr:hypothetical protein [Sphingomonas sp. SORGH_AS_0879]